MLYIPISLPFCNFIVALPAICHVRVMTLLVATPVLADTRVVREALMTPGKRSHAVVG